MITKTMMPSLKKVGTKVGEYPNRVRSSSKGPSTMEIVQYFHQHPAQPFTEKDLPEHLQDQSALNNCFHLGYILRILPESEKHYLYFHPHHTQVDLVKAQFIYFEGLTDQQRSEQKVKLIQELFDKIVAQNEINFSEEENTDHSQAVSSEPKVSLEVNIHKKINWEQFAMEEKSKQIEEKSKQIQKLQSELQKLQSQYYEHEISLKTLKSILQKN